MLQARCHILLNPNSGGAMRLGVTAERLHTRFAARGEAVSLDADPRRPFDERLQIARNSTAQMQAVLFA